MNTPLKPHGWGDDSLAEFLDTARNNVFATFERLNPAFHFLSEIDKSYRLIAGNLKNPPEWFVALFLLRAHSSYLGAAHLSLATQLPESFMVQRGCLEHALYALYFHHHPDSHERWLRRNESTITRRAVRDEFKTGVMLALLKKDDVALHALVETLYERSIDYGAHPNALALTQMLKMTETADGGRFDVRYLTADELTLKFAIGSIAQVGVATLRVFQHIWRERFDLIGLSAKLEELRHKLRVLPEHS